MINSVSKRRKWKNLFNEKYCDNLKRLKYYFPEAYKFLKDIEKLEEYGFHMGTAVNMHFYYKEHFLFYFKFLTKNITSSRPIKFSPKYNLRLKWDAQVNSSVLFFNPLIEKLNNSGLFQHGTIEKRHKMRNDHVICEIYVYPFETSEIFFNICRDVIAEIAFLKAKDIF